MAATSVVIGKTGAGNTYLVFGALEIFNLFTAASECWAFMLIGERWLDKCPEQCHDSD